MFTRNSDHSHVVGGHLFHIQTWEAILLRTKIPREHILKYKFIYTFLILMIYLLGKNIPLYGLEQTGNYEIGMDAETLMVQAISGDIYRHSLFALGIAPYMMASLIVQFLYACRSKEAKSRISPKKRNRNILAVTMLFAIVQAILQTGELEFGVTGTELLWAQGIAALEMVTGAMMILWLSERNRQYGIGGQTTLILVNIVEGILTTLGGQEAQQLAMPLVASGIVILIVLFMENTEKRIPVQRISIHNIYADKNYMSIKLNPIGVMPAMFSTAVFLLPQLLIRGLVILFPENEDILWWEENMTLSQPVGIAVYIAILYILTIVFSRVFLNPTEITEQFLKSGDSLVDIHAGRDTKRYLSGTINRMSFISATVMAVCLGGPMYLQLRWNMDGGLVMLPSSAMMLTGMLCNLYREYAALRDLEAYRPFI